MFAHDKARQLHQTRAIYTYVRGRPFWMAEEGHWQGVGKKHCMILAPFLYGTDSQSRQFCMGNGNGSW
jgi:hypothetical protein